MRFMIPLHAPALNLKNLFAIPDDNYILKLQEYFTKTFNKKNAIFTSDGRNAINLALKICGLKPRDEILLPGYVCHAVPEAIKPICKPVYVDIDEKTCNIDPKKIEENITDKTKAIIVAHLYGNPCDMDAIVDVARDKNLVLIEDVAQSLNGRYNGIRLGSIGDFSIFSFRFTKDITSFRGGVLLTNEDISFNPEHSTSSAIQLFVTLSAMKQIKMMPAVIYNPLRKHVLFPYFKESGSKFHVNRNTLSNYQCYLLYHQLKKLDRIIEKRRENAKYYSKMLDNIVAIPNETKKGVHTYYRYSIQCDKREKLQDYLLKHGIEADRMYDYYLAPLHNCILASENNINIPVHHELKSDDLKKIVEAINEFKQME